MTRRTFLTICGLGFAGSAFSLARFQTRLEQIGRKADRENWGQLPIGKCLVNVALEMLGTPYVGGTLDIDDDREACIVTLDGMDCVTFYELSLCIARLLKREKLSEANLTREVTLTRYRGGKLNGFTSRLHYTTDWMRDNESKGVVRVVTSDLPGARSFDQKIDFMSTHPASYRQLKNNPERVKKMAGIERDLMAEDLLYLPKERVAAAEKLLRAGDIVGITTSIAGLDCSHTGLCYEDESKTIRLLHASTTHKKVVLDVRLSQYLAGIGKDTGIVVARPLEPK